MRFTRITSVEDALGALKPVTRELSGSIGMAAPCSNGALLVVKLS
jgi:hypothetical protein